jgi:hypothetical protein
MYIGAALKGSYVKAGLCLDAVVDSHRKSGLKAEEA